MPSAGTASLCPPVRQGHVHGLLALAVTAILLVAASTVYVRVSGIHVPSAAVWTDVAAHPDPSTPGAAHTNTSSGVDVPATDAAVWCNMGPSLDVFAKNDVDVASLRRTMVHTGSLARLTRVLEGARQGSAIKLAVIGGSVSAGVAGLDGKVTKETYARVFLAWLEASFPGNHTFTNSARGGSGSEYWRFCYRQHIRCDEDIILLDVAVNDAPYTPEALRELALSEERLIRSLLALPQRPAIILVGLAAGSYASAEQNLLALAAYYDLPLVSIRELYNSWVTSNFSTRAAINVRFGVANHHINAEGHALVGHLVIYLVQRYALQCGGSVLPEQQLLRPGRELELMPDQALFVQDRFSQVHSNCWTVYSSAQPLARAPSAPRPSSPPPDSNTTANTCGWAPYSVQYKEYWRTTEANASCAFAFETVQDRMNVYIYSLKAVYLNGSLGECWIDDEDGRHGASRVAVSTHLPPERVDQAHVIEFNIGVHTLIGVVDKAGNHSLSCRMVHGSDFRIMGILVD